MLMKKKIDIVIRISEKELIELLKLDGNFKLDHAEYFASNNEIYITGHQRFPEPDKK